MKWSSLIIYTILSVIVLYIQLKAYQKLSYKEKYKYNIYNYICILLAGILITYNSYINVNALRAYISFGIILFLELIIYKDKLRKTIVYGTISYIFVVISEIILSIFVVATNLLSMETIDSNYVYKCGLSILMSLLAYLFTKSKRIRKLSQKIYEKLEKSMIPLVLLIISLLIVLVIAFRNVSDLSVTDYVTSIILLILFAFLVIFIIKNEYNTEQEMDKARVLLDFMSKYEKKIDEERINKHEILNNLLILKSFSNKNTKKYNDTLDDLIKTYSKKSIGVKNIYKLPCGLKGIIYYKINEVKNKNLNINIHISKQLSNYLENMDSKTYTIICKIVGITFDNAIEASENSLEKFINLDVYEENNLIIIDIENSYSNKIDMKKLNKKNYSTKGLNRGFGLYIVNSLIKHSDNLKLEQIINDNIFITKLVITKNLD